MTKKFLLSGMIAAVAIVGGLGYFIGRQSPVNVIVTEFENTNPGGENPVNFGLFWQVWDKLKAEHIKGEDIDVQKSLYGSIVGLVDSLGDPNTQFFPPADSQKFLEDVQGRFGGIGAEIGRRNGNIIVIAPLKGTPAERAGVQANDLILAVDGEPLHDIDPTEAVKIIRGPVGTSVILTMYRDAWEKPRDITIVREEIMVPTVDWEIIEGSLGHLQLHSFNGNAINHVSAAIQAFRNEGVNGIILDLRNNPGGFLDVGILLSSWFLPPDSPVVEERPRLGEPEVFRSRGNGTLKDVPLVVLVNGGSASASEIMAGALRDVRGVPLVGQKTFGKGTVQELQALPDGSQLKITIAQWVTPNGTIIEKNGLEPDYVVEFTEEDAEAKRDLQLKKAIEVLKEEIAKSLNASTNNE